MADSAGFQVAATLSIYIENGSKFTRGKKKVREAIDQLVTRDFDGRILDETYYHVVIRYEDETDLKLAIEDLVDEIHSAASLRNCVVHDLSLCNEETGQYWDDCDGGWLA